MSAQAGTQQQICMDARAAANAYDRHLVTLVSMTVLAFCQMAGKASVKSGRLE